MDRGLDWGAASLLLAPAALVVCLLSVRPLTGDLLGPFRTRIMTSESNGNARPGMKYGLGGCWPVAEAWVAAHAALRQSLEDALGLVRPLARDLVN